MREHEERVWANSRATKTHLLILLWVAKNADEDGNFHTRLTDISKKLHIHVFTVRNAIYRLRDLGELDCAVFSPLNTPTIARIKL